MAELVALGGALLSASVKLAFHRISTSSKFIKFFKRKKEIKFDEEDLDNLQHFDVRDKIYGNVLEHLGKLQPCDSLNIIGLEDTDVVTTEGAKIEELKDESCIENLTLEGSHIIGLGDTDVVATEEAKREELKDQSCIESLTLEWNHNAECSELKKFAKLEPHTNIKKLSIKGYTGSRFPDWLGVSSFSNMEFVSLKNCKNCLSLPPLGQLTGLQTLKISGVDGISEIGKEFYGDDSTSKPFQALEKLVFREMAEWAKWSTHSVVFPSLKSLSISNCNNILSFSEGGLAALNLKVLEVTNCKKMKSLPAGMHTQIPLPNELIIEDCPKIECFPEGGLPHSLETLDIWNCSKMRTCQTNWGLQALPSLKKVSLSGFEDTLFPEEGSLPTSLQYLSIGSFHNLDSLNEEGLQHMSSLQTLQTHSCLNLQYLPQQKFSSSLSEVYIRNCEVVESFPEGLASSLSTLIIIGCRKLAARIQREKVVSHIPNIEIW